MRSTKKKYRINQHIFDEINFCENRKNRYTNIIGKDFRSRCNLYESRSSEIRNIDSRLKRNKITQSRY